jgi:hypothetical protein
MPDKARRKEQARQAAMREAVEWLRGMACASTSRATTTSRSAA